MKQKKFLRHHWFLIGVFAVILLLAVVAFILQRSTNLDVIAGEAIRQQIDETKQLALSDEAVKIAEAVKVGQKQVFMECPPQLLPNEQHWKIPTGWKVRSWIVVKAECSDSVMFCTYANGKEDMDWPGRLVMVKDLQVVDKCSPQDTPSPGCKCFIKQ